MLNTSRKTLKTKHGLTLIEVMMAVFVLALSGIMLAAIFPTAQISRIKGVYSTYAVSLAQQRIEELRAAGYASVKVGNTSVAVSDLPGGTETILITQYLPNIKKVQVSIVWEGYRKAGGTVVLTTLLSDHS